MRRRIRRKGFQPFPAAFRRDARVCLIGSGSVGIASVCCFLPLLLRNPVVPQDDFLRFRAALHLFSHLAGMHFPESVQREISLSRGGVIHAFRGQQPVRIILPVIGKGPDLSSLEKWAGFLLRHPLQHPIVFRPDSSRLIPGFHLNHRQGHPVDKKGNVRPESAASPSAHQLRRGMKAVLPGPVPVRQIPSLPSVPKHPVKSMSLIRPVQHGSNLLRQAAEGLSVHAPSVDFFHCVMENLRQKIDLPVPLNAFPRKVDIPQPGKMDQCGNFHPCVLPPDPRHASSLRFTGFGLAQPKNRLPHSGLSFLRSKAA